MIAIRRIRVTTTFLMMEGAGAHGNDSMIVRILMRVPITIRVKFLLITSTVDLSY